MFYLFLAVLLLNAAAVYIFDRIEWLKKNRVVLGVLFGLLSALANELRIEVIEPKVFFSLLDIPILSAAFFFGPVPGLIAGLIAVLFRLATNLFFPTNYWYLACIAVLLISVYGILTERYFFDRKRPNLIPCIFGMVFGEFIRVILFFLSNTAIEGDTFSLVMFNNICVFFVAVAGAAVLAVAAAGSWGTIRSNLLNKTVLLFVLFDLGCIGILGASVTFAKKNAKRTMMAGGVALYKSFHDQVRYVLRDSAVYFTTSEPGLRHYTHEQMQQLAEKTRFDEINIYDSNGNLVESNSPAVLKSGRHLDFQPVQEGPLRKNPIMETGFDTGYRLKPDRFFRIITPFADGSGYYEIGILEELTYVDYEIMLIPLMKERSFGENGYYVVTNADGQIVIPVFKHPAMVGKNIRDFGITEKDLAMKDYQTFTLFFDNQWCACYKFTTTTGDTTFAFLPVREFLGPYLSQGCITCLFLIVLLFFTQITVYTIRKAWKKIEIMQQEKLNMVQKNLEMARNIQLDELRSDSPEDGHGRVESFICPAEAVGGDFYDYFRLSNGRKVCVIGDVSGEGIPAALFMMKAKTAIRENTRTASSLVEAVTAVNEYLCRNNSSMMFVTLWIGSLDVTTGEGEYICAGHNHPLWAHADREAEWFPGTQSMALGISPRAKYSSRHVQLKCGDRVFLYTDGVTEAKNRLGEQFSADRLKKIIEQGKDSDIQRVYREILKFTDSCPQSDDITMLDIQFL